MPSTRATKDQSLTDLIMQYQRTGGGLSEILSRIGPLVYRYPKRVRGSSEDDCGEFYCHFFPRIPSLINRFRFSGVEFEAYLSSSMRWQYKTFVKEKAKRSHAKCTLHGESFWPKDLLTEPDVAECVVREVPASPPRVRSVLSVNEQGVIEDPIAARRVILLLLKASQETDDSMVARVARLTGVPEEWLSCKVGELHARLEHRRQRRGLVRRRRDQAFFRLRFFEARIQIEVDPAERERLTRLIGQERAHLENAIRTLARVPVSPTHRDIAEVLDVPKGSVDSSLYYLKRSLDWRRLIAETQGSN